MHASVNEVLARLGSIPPDDLRVLVAHIEAFLKRTGTEPREAPDRRPGKRLTGASDQAAALWVLEVVVGACKNMQINFPPMRVLRTNSAFTGNEYKLDAVAHWLRPVGRRAARAALLALGTRKLVEYLRQGVPTRWDNEQARLIRTPKLAVGWREILIFIDYLPVILENQFPGYHKAGLLHMIVNPHKQQRKGNLHARR